MLRPLALVLVALAVFVAGCASAPMSGDQQALFQDAAFAPAKQSVSSVDLFTVSPAMQRWLDSHLPAGAADGRAKRYQRELIDALYDGRALGIDYDAAVTRNAADTFDVRAGNCLSLVIMTAAFAKALELDVQYQSIDVNETWGRGEGMVFAIGHVNVTLGKRRTSLLDVRQDHVALTVDFFPPEATTGQRSWPISENTVVAMYLNNRAVEALAAGRVDDAYWWAREAIHTDARFMAPYNTLGVVYRRHGLLGNAAIAFGRVISADPYNTKAISNLATVFEAQGKSAEASQMQARLASLTRSGLKEPFASFNRGLQYMQAGDFPSARDAFALELARDPFNDEVNFWQARALVGLGELKRAGEHLSTAIEFSTTLKKRDLYAAKLDHIRAYRR